MIYHLPNLLPLAATCCYRVFDEITDIPPLDVLLSCLLVAMEGRVLGLFRGWEESLELERSLLLRDGYVRRLIPR